MSKIIIRNGRLKDADIIWKLMWQLEEPHISAFPIDFKMMKDSKETHLKFFKTGVRSRTKKVLIAEKDGEIVGLLMGAIEKRPPVLKITRQAHIWEIVVTKSMKRQGIGKKLMEEFYKWSKEQGIKYVVLEVIPPNKEAIKFYKHEGFETLLHVERKFL